eukprot:SAG11_NODE_448_length_9392_cov_17.782978_4_plen_235_part_00
MMGSVGVQVVARLRPLNRREEADGTLPVVSASTNDKTVTVIRGEGNRARRSGFKVDNVFGSFATQVEVYDQTMPPIIKDVLRGFQSTVFAYGQTGTGKTHTMEGIVDDPEQMGIIPRAANHLFESLQGDQFVDSTVSVSYLEIYNEELNDLLVETAPKAERTNSRDKYGNGGSKAKKLEKVSHSLRWYMQTPDVCKLACFSARPFPDNNNRGSRSWRAPASRRAYTAAACSRNA